MKVVFSSLPGYGHLYPIMPLALAFADAGHGVTIATSEPFTDRLPLPTILSLPVGTTFHQLEHEAVRRHPEILAGLPETALDLPITLFGEICPEQTVPMLLTAFEQDRPDLVVYEVSDVGAAIAADLLGIPAVAFGLGQWHPILTEWHARGVAHQRDRWTEPPQLLGRYLDPMPPSLRKNLTGIPIRPVPWSQPGPVPQWPDNGRPRVYITLGTVAFGAVEVLRRAILETAAHDVDVLVAAGPKSDPAALGELPANVRVERYVPQDEVLQQVDLAVHHGGAGTMLGALANGVPQLILPQGADQFFNAITITEAQAGRGIRNEEQVPGAIGAAVGDLLADGRERLTAKQFAHEIAAMPAPSDVVAMLIQDSRLS
jgi:UDP:flavonoid glycosyltransferase YjiC (YdhE family)